MTPNLQEALAFYCAIGFRLSDYVVPPDSEEPFFVFQRRQPSRHLAAASQTRVLHVAYTVPETSFLMVAADHLARAGMAENVEFGPARHFSPGLARLLLVRIIRIHRERLFSEYQHDTSNSDGWDRMRTMGDEHG